MWLDFLCTRLKRFVGLLLRRTLVQLVRKSAKAESMV